MPIMEISIIPVGTKGSSLSKYVSDILKVLKQQKDIDYMLTPMGTIISSKSLSLLFKIAKELHKVPFKNDVKRVVTNIKIDDRKDKELTMEGKIKAVTDRLN